LRKKTLANVVLGMKNFKNGFFGVVLWTIENKKTKLPFKYMFNFKILKK